MGAALRVDPAIGGFQRARGPAAHAKCFGKGIIGVDEASNRELGGFASALVSTDAVGDRGDDVAVAPTGPAEAGPDVILIGGALAGLADEADANPEISLRTDRHPRDLPNLQRGSLDPRSRCGAPCGAPADLDHGKSQEPKQRQQAEKQEARAESAGHSLGDAERLGKEETADAAGAADHAGHQADLLTEAERNELKHGGNALASPTKPPKVMK